MQNRKWSLLTILLLMTFIWAQPDISVAPLQFDIALSHYTNDLVADCTLSITDNGDGLEFGWQEIDSNPTLTFTKADYADWTLPQNQDRISSSVWIARKDNQSLYNAASEVGYNNPYYNDPISPAGTLWHFDGIVPVRGISTGPAGYWSFVQANNYDPQSIIGVPGSLFLVADSVFLDIVFHSFSGGNTGGGFSYTRESYGVPWMTVEDMSVRAGSWALNVNFDATNLVKGNYAASIVITSNDADTPEITIPVSLTVDGPVPVVSVTPVAIDAGTLVQGESDSTTHKIVITNTGDADLYWNLSFEDLTPGEEIYFEKQDYANWNLPENQDRITDDVWLTRQNNNGLFNIAVEGSCDDYTSPSGTEWWWGPTNQFDPTEDSYEAFKPAANFELSDLPESVMSLHLIDEDRYYDVYFHDWSCCDNGGFAYTRMTPDYKWIGGSKIDGIVPGTSTETVRVLSVGQSDTVDVYFMSGRIPGGDYSGNLTLQTNDPLNPEIVIPVQLNIFVPPPIAAVNVESIDAGTLIQGESDVTTHKIILTNTGEGDLNWRAKFIDNSPVAVYFEKANYADRMLPENQDFITENVILTRADEEGLFNIAQEYYYTDNNSPYGTEWSSYPTSESSPEDYGSWRNNAHPYNGGPGLGAPTSLHLIDEDIYFDVIFHTWTSGEDEGGGGFSYTRSTPQYHWIDAEMNSGVIPGYGSLRTLSVGQSDTIDLYFYSEDIPGGDYWGDIIIKTNDPVNPEFVIPVTLNIYEPLPVISVDVTAINGTASLYDEIATDTEQITITNSGDADLIIEMTLEGGGIPVTFTKMDYADYTNPANQDYITENVIITRQTYQGIFNIAVEASYDRNYGRYAPTGTLWARGATKFAHPESYTTWYNATNRLYQNGMNEVFSMYLTEDDLYFDVVFHQWTAGGQGGGFSYTRTPAYPGWVWLPVANDTITYDQPDRAAETYAVEFDATGLEPGYYHSELIIRSNDPLQRKIVLPVEFFVDGPMPTVDLLPANIDLSLKANEIDTSLSVNIANNGDADLLWSLRIDNPNPETVTFTKEDWADWYLPQNQDRITNSVWITRADFRGIFNMARESSYSDGDRALAPPLGGDGASPIGTVWAPGPTNNVRPEMYTSWENAVNENPPASVGRTYSMYLYWDNLYFDVTFNHWTIGEYGGGGGFSYTRTQVGAPWLETASRDGQVPFGTAQDVKLKFDTYNMPGGDYYANIFVRSNGYDGAEGMIPIHLFVDGPVHTPVITGVVDVPADQGGWVRVFFNRSFFDTDVPADPTRAAEAYTVEINDGSGWTAATTTVAYGQESYSVLVPTTRDSINAEQNGIIGFRVVAGLEEGNWISAAMEGYSVDNIAPMAPTGLLAAVSEGAVNLTWDESAAEDLGYFKVYRSAVDNFVPSTENLIGTTETTLFVDTEISQVGQYYYRVSAMDANGNESEYSTVTMVVLSAEDGFGLPRKFALHHNYPNPFNPVTSIRYDLPAQAFVRIRVFDLLGKEIATLVNGTQEAGYQSVRWNATDRFGQPVSAGVYLYQIQAGEFSQTYKMVLLK
ncbi:MAG: T9SS type A sorting domain-containing protein [Candidatus Neomarinimicrobiota bacterium]